MERLSGHGDDLTGVEKPCRCRKPCRCSNARSVRSSTKPAAPSSPDTSKASVTSTPFGARKSPTSSSLPAAISSIAVLGKQSGNYWEAPRRTVSASTAPARVGHRWDHQGSLASATGRGTAAFTSRGCSHSRHFSPEGCFLRHTDSSSVISWESLLLDHSWRRVFRGWHGRL